MINEQHPPCPFCGGLDAYESSDDVTVCPDCAAMGPAGYSTRDWSTRAAPRVRDLVWVAPAHISSNPSHDPWIATCSIGLYMANEHGFWLGDGLVESRNCLSAAKAAAQADYTARILSALEETQ